MMTTIITCGLVVTNILTCGVVTSTAFVFEYLLMVVMRAKCSSEVPGGVSTTKKSNSPQSTCPNKLSLMKAVFFGPKVR